MKQFAYAAGGKGGPPPLIGAGSRACKFWYTVGMCRWVVVRQASYAGGLGAARPPSGGCGGQSPPASMPQCIKQRERGQHRPHVDTCHSIRKYKDMTFLECH